MMQERYSVQTNYMFEKPYSYTVGYFKRYGGASYQTSWISVETFPADEDNCTGMGMSDEEMDAYNEGIDAMYSLIKGARPIIEADRREE